MTDQIKPQDSLQRSWVDIMPAAIRPYLRLARADRPIGTWLLLWPCWWSLALAAHAQGGTLPNLWLMLLFAVGAFAMRGAGCTYNDIIDRHVDAQVERTKGRPIPSGQVSVIAAWIFAIALSFLGLGVLLQFNTFTILLGIGSLPIVALYPFAKRFTNWPQAVLGLAFNWGALMGWASVMGTIGIAPLLLYAAGILWTLGYDTIYAHQDLKDDSIIGVKSTAVRLGKATKSWVNGFYACAALLLIVAVVSVGGGWLGAIIILAACVHLGWQIQSLDIEDGRKCLRLFRSNRDFGAFTFVAILISAALS